MANHDQILNLYAENGMRTQEDWTAMGRETQPDAKARVEIVHKGKNLALYTRDQTKVRPRAPRKPAKAAPAAIVAVSVP